MGVNATLECGTGSVYCNDVHRWQMTFVVLAGLLVFTSSLIIQGGCASTCQEGTESCACVIGSGCELGLSCIGGLCVLPDEYDTYTTGESESETTATTGEDDVGTTNLTDTETLGESSVSSGVPEPEPEPQGDPYGDPALGCPANWQAINLIDEFGDIEGRVCSTSCDFSSTCRDDTKIPELARCFYDDTQEDGLCVLECSTNSDCWPQDPSMFCSNAGICVFVP